MSAAVPAGLAWRLVHLLARALRPGEDEAVLGDLLEAGDTGARALFEVLGLLARYGGAWAAAHARSLLAASPLLPFALLLGVASRGIADRSAIPIWGLLNNTDAALLRTQGYWYVFGEIAPSVLLSCFELACWAWMAGFVLARVAGRYAWRGAALCCMTVCSAQWRGVPPLLRPLLVHLRGRDFAGNRVVFAGFFYSGIFPWLVQGACVVLPAICGVREGMRLRTLPLLSRTILVCSAVVSIAALFAQSWAGWQNAPIITVFTPLLAIVGAAGTLLALQTAPPPSSTPKGDLFL